MHSPRFVPRGRRARTPGARVRPLSATGPPRPCLPAPRARRLPAWAGGGALPAGPRTGVMQRRRRGAPTPRPLPSRDGWRGRGAARACKPRGSCLFSRRAAGNRGVGVGIGAGRGGDGPGRRGGRGRRARGWGAGEGPPSAPITRKRAPLGRSGAPAAGRRRAAGGPREASLKAGSARPPPHLEQTGWTRTLLHTDTMAKRCAARAQQNCGRAGRGAAVQPRAPPGGAWDRGEPAAPRRAPRRRAARAPP
jgi:hypothetical protein